MDKKETTGSFPSTKSDARPATSDAHPETLPYQQYDRKPTRRKRIVIAVAIIAAVTLTPFVRRWFFRLAYAPNAAFNYPDRVGAIDALYDIREGVRSFSLANGGSLPTKLSDVKPFLPQYGRRKPVTAETLLPHVSLVPTNGIPPIEVGPGQYVLMVYVVGTGPMDYNVTLALGETGDGWKDMFADDQITAAYGKARLLQLQQNALDLP